MSQLQVVRDELTRTRIVDDGSSDDVRLGDNEILAKVDRFALTANNITYGVVGDELGYWKFFPPTDDEADRWGLIPVWGFADVVRSNIAEIPVGDRLFGYFPPATHLKLAPVRVRDDSFFDSSAHRAELPAGYNIYRRVNAEPGYDRATDAERMLFFPLHVTSFCLWDVLSMNDWFGAKQIIIVSASSKTSIGLAYGLDADDDAPTVIGVTSERNRGFTEGLDAYDAVVTYDDVTAIDAFVPSVIVDMAGNDRILLELNDHLGENMVSCIRVGVTHRDAAKGEAKLESSTWFFAPSHIEQRMKEWGPDGFMAKSVAFMQKTAARSRDWLKVTPVDGLDGMAAIFADVANGNIPAEQGLIVELTAANCS